MKNKEIIIITLALCWTAITISTIAIFGICGILASNFRDLLEIVGTYTTFVTLLLGAAHIPTKEKDNVSKKIKNLDFKNYVFVGGKKVPTIKEEGENNG